MANVTDRIIKGKCEVVQFQCHVSILKTNIHSLVVPPGSCGQIALRATVLNVGLSGGTERAAAAGIGGRVGIDAACSHCWR